MREEAIANAVLQTHGSMFSTAAGIDLRKNTPSPLYLWLVTTTLLSARISQDLALEAAQALKAQGWRTARRMARVSHAARVTVLNRAGYARVDESASRMLGEGAQMVLDHYGGDLRHLRAGVAGDLGELRERLEGFMGIGPTGADIFVREVQCVWDEFYPFVDQRALDAAGDVDLPQDAEKLSRLVSKKDFAALLAGLIRMSREGDADEIRKVA